MSEGGLPHRGAQVLGQDMAQNMFSMSRVRNDTEHENIQRFQQTSILRSVSINPLTYEAVNIAIYGPNKLRQCGSTNVGKKRHHIKVEAINANQSLKFSFSTEGSK